MVKLLCRKTGSLPVFLWGEGRSFPRSKAGSSRAVWLWLRPCRNTADSPRGFADHFPRRGRDVLRGKCRQAHTIPELPFKSRCLRVIYGRNLGNLRRISAGQFSPNFSAVRWIWFPVRFFFLLIRVPHGSFPAGPNFLWQKFEKTSTGCPK